jgi:hypothetical protein
MITVQKTDDVVSVAVFGEFTLVDYQEFEKLVLFTSHSDGKVNVLFDLREMMDYTIDVAWEDIKFIREHDSEFNRVAVVTNDQWQAWSAWISNLFINADVSVFSDPDQAMEWLTAEG